jgi:hypothetical protein
VTRNLFEPESAPIVETLNIWAPPDVDAAHEAWGATCGPCAVAALWQLHLYAVRPAFPWFSDRPWTTPTQMVEACRALGGDPRLIQAPPDTAFSHPRLGKRMPMATAWHGISQMPLFAVGDEGRGAA